MLVVALIAIFHAIIAVINKFAGTSYNATAMLVGALAVVGAFIWNTILGVVNAVIGIGVELWNLIATFANFFANVFNDPVGAILKLFSGMFDFILGIVQEAAKFIDTVLGSDISGKVEKFRNNFAKTVDDIVGEQVVVMEKLNASDYQFERKGYEDAYNAGYKFGEDLGNRFKDVEENGNSDYLNDVYNNTNAIEGSAAAIEDSVDLSNEELKFLREIAEREAINQFTTVPLQVTFHTNNSVNSEIDLDSMMTSFSEKIVETIHSSAEAVHV